MGNQSEPKRLTMGYTCQSSPAPDLYSYQRFSTSAQKIPNRSLTVWSLHTVPYLYIIGPLSVSMCPTVLHIKEVGPYFYLT